MLGGGILLLMVLLPLAIATLNAQERLPQPDPPQVNGRTVSWNAVENAAGYRLRWRRSDQNWNQAPRLDTSATHHTFSTAELPDGAAYRVQVRALSGDRAQRDNSPWSDAADLTATVPATATPMPTATLTPTLTHTPTDTPTPTATTTPTLTATPADRLKPVTGLRFLPSNGAGLGTFQWDLLPKPDGEFHRTFQVRYRPHDAAQWQSEAGFYGVFNLMQVRDWSPYVPWQVQVRAVDEEQPHLNGEWSAVATMQPLPRPTATYTPSPTHTFTATPPHSPTPTFTHTPTYTYTPTFTLTPTYTYTPSPTATFTPTHTPTPTPLPTLPAPTGLTWNPTLNEFSWKKVAHASGIKGTDCSGHYLVKQVMTASEHGTTAPGPPLFFGVKREGYNDIICPEGQDFCLIRWANIVGYENDPENSNTLSVKACGDGVNWADSPFASIKAHETSSYVPPDACTRTLPNHPGYELDYVTSPVEFLSSTGNLYCSYYRQYVCTKLDNEDNWASKIIVGDAIRSAFALLADDESASRQSFDVRAEIDRLVAAQIDPSILYVEWEMNAFEIQPTPCYDTSRPFSPPTLGPWAREGQRLVITWTGKGDVYEIRIDGEDSPEAEFYTLSRELPDASYEFFYIRNIPEHTHHTFSIRASYNAIRKTGQVVRAASDWVTLVLKTATPIPSITPLPTSTPWPTATPQGKLGRVTGLRFAPQHITNRLGTLNWDFMVTSGLGYHRDYEVRYRPNETASWLTEPALYYYFELSSVNDWSPYIPWQAQVRAIHADNPSLHGDWSEVITLQALPTPTPSQSPTPLLGNVTHLAFLYDDRLIEGELDPIHLLCVDYDGDLHLPNLWFYVFIDASTYGAFNASVPLDYELRSWLARAANAGDDGHTLLERIEHHDRCATLPDSAIPTINRKRTYCVHAYREDEKSNTLCATASLELIAGTPKPDDP